MPAPAPIPEALRTHPFTRAQARAAGLTDTQLRGKRFVQLLRGVYLCADLEPGPAHWARAGLELAPKDAIVSHVTALALWGLDLPGRHPVHVSTNEPRVTRVVGLVGHRREAGIARRVVRGVPVTSPERTLIDLGTWLTKVWLIIVAEWMMHAGLINRRGIAAYAENRHLSGVGPVRDMLPWVREGAESPMETAVRLMIVFAFLPQPECNQNIVDDDGNFVARVDMVYRRWLVAIEYDGRWHERSSAQRTRDRDRRERLERMGWTVIVIYDADLADPARIPWRVFHALRDHGWRGREPQLTGDWATHFARGNFWRVLCQNKRAK